MCGCPPRTEAVLGSIALGTTSRRWRTLTIGSAAAVAGCPRFLVIPRSVRGRLTVLSAATLGVVRKVSDHKQRTHSGLCLRPTNGFADLGGRHVTVYGHSRSTRYIQAHACKRSFPFSCATRNRGGCIQERGSIVPKKCRVLPESVCILGGLESARLQSVRAPFKNSGKFHGGLPVHGSILHDAIPTRDGNLAKQPDANRHPFAVRACGTDCLSYLRR